MSINYENKKNNITRGGRYMYKETYFFRNLENLKTLRDKTSDKIKDNKTKSKYNVIATIDLSDEDFNAFCSDFKRNYKFLYDYIDLMKVDKNAIWQCVEINGKILVQNNGYSYPRFTGIVL